MVQYSYWSSCFDRPVLDSKFHFSKKIENYLDYLEGHPISKIIKKHHPEKTQFSSYSKESEYIGMQIKEVKMNVAIAFNKKLSL